MKLTTSEDEIIRERDFQSKAEYSNRNQGWMWTDTRLELLQGSKQVQRLKEIRTHLGAITTQMEQEVAHLPPVRSSAPTLTRRLRSRAVWTERYMCVSGELYFLYDLL